MQVKEWSFMCWKICGKSEPWMGIYSNRIMPEEKWAKAMMTHYRRNQYAVWSWKVLICLAIYLSIISLSILSIQLILVGNNSKCCFFTSVICQVFSSILTYTWNYWFTSLIPTCLWILGSIVTFSWRLFPTPWIR